MLHLIVLFLCYTKDCICGALEHNKKSISGGTFAIYSLLCRHAKVGLIPNQHAEDCDMPMPNNKVELPNRRTQRALWLKSKIENSNFAKHLLIFATMLGTSMLIGDGVLTPSMSGLLIHFPFFILH